MKVKYYCKFGCRARFTVDYEQVNVNDMVAMRINCYCPVCKKVAPAID